MRVIGVILAIAIVATAVYFSPRLASLALFLLLLLTLVNAASYSFFARERHPLFALLVLPLHLLFLSYSMLALAIGLVSYGFDWLAGRDTRSRWHKSVTPQTANHRTEADAR
jgi:hypothetical protein